MVNKQDESIETYRRVLAIKPNHKVALNNLGTSLGRIGKTDEAIAFLRRAVIVDPAYQNAWTNLGGALSAGRQSDEALDAFRRALAMKADDIWALNGTANALRDLGRASEALEFYRKSLQLEPRPDVLSNLVMCLFYIEASTARDILAEAIRFEREFAAPVTREADPSARTIPPIDEVLATSAVEDVGDIAEIPGQLASLIGRPLRVGYLSPEFVGHPVGWFMLPLLEHHDRKVVEIVGYFDSPYVDEQTRKLKAQTSLCRDITDVDDTTVANLIRQDRIDILVELSGHTGSNRLMLMARRPAPVQVTYLWHAGTTGMSAIDWRFGDRWFDPDGVEAAYTERTIRLGSYWCYRPPLDAGEPGPSPVASGEPITFGCLNEHGKITEVTLSAWARILSATPNSRLLIHAPAASSRRRIEAVLDRHGLAHDRLIGIGKLKLADYFDCYRRIDIALDPFPYGGGTTSCDAIWMGVPVVTRAGRTAVGRGGISILSLIGHPELVADNVEQYVDTAVALAADVSRLVKMRTSLRGEMAGSLLMDEVTHARQIERAYLRMWQIYKSRTTGHS
jgi:predicted O-linked N-acetylglucosamine transferase (SPINDLY family)